MTDIKSEELCSFDMLDYWFDKHGDIDGHTGYDEASYRHHRPELMRARDRYLAALRAFELEVKQG
jgi:hypothetical protein